MMKNHCFTFRHNLEIPQQQLSQNSATRAEEAERLRSLIDHITEQRISLLTRFNDKHSATKDLPFEILSTIFNFACQPLEPEFLGKSQCTSTSNSAITITCPSILAAVSSHWQDIVNTSPQLWTFIRAEVNERNLTRVVSLLRHHFKKSGTLGVTIELDFQIQSLIKCGRQMKRIERRQCHSAGYYFPDNEGQIIDQEDHELLDPVRSIIFDEFPEKVREIRLFNAPIEWLKDSKSPFCDRFLLIEAIKLSWSYIHLEPYDYTDLQFNFNNLPKLKEVLIFGLPGHRYIAPHFIISTNLTELHLSKIDYHTCITILPHCPHLRSFSMMRPSFRRPNFEENPMSNINCIQMAYLETFEWTFPQPDWIYYAEERPDILRLLNAPLLQTLILHEPWTFQWVFITVKEFINRLPKSCQSISLVTSFLHASEHINILIADILMTIPKSVTQIELRTTCIHFANSIDDNLYEASLIMCRILTKISVVKENRRWGNAYRGNCAQNPEYCRAAIFNSSAFLDHMTMRLGLKMGLKKFSLEYDTNITGSIEWKEGDKEVLRELVIQGKLDLEILEDGKQVEWLRV